jgi:hypothetical protein
MTTGVVIFGDGRIRFGSLQTSNTAILIGTVANANVGLGMDAVGSMYLHSDPAGWVFVDRLRLGNLVFAGDGSGNVGVNVAPATTGQLFVGAPANFTGGVIVSTGDMYVTSNFACSGVTTLNSVAADTVNVVSLLTASVASIQTLGVNNIETTSKPAGTVFAAPANADGAAQWRQLTAYDQRVLYSRIPYHCTGVTFNAGFRGPQLSAALVAKSSYAPVINSTELPEFNVGLYGIDVDKSVINMPTAPEQVKTIKINCKRLNLCNAFTNVWNSVNCMLAFYDPATTTATHLFYHSGSPGTDSFIGLATTKDGGSLVDVDAELVVTYLGLIGTGGAPRISAVYNMRMHEFGTGATHTCEDVNQMDLPAGIVVNGVFTQNLKLGMGITFTGVSGMQAGDHIYNNVDVVNPVVVEIIKPQQAW